MKNIRRFTIRICNFLPLFKKILMEYFTLFILGGVLYSLIEIAFRGYTHPAMFIAGALSLIFVGLINEVLSWNTPLLLQMLIGGTLITFIEFIFGVILNIVLHLNVWDYSNLPLNLLGQISPLFWLAWCFLSLVAIIIDDYIRYYLFGEEKPHYK